MKNVISLLKYLKPYKKWAFLAPLLIVFEVIMDLCMPNIMANVINIGIGENNTNYIVFNIILMCILTILGILGSIGSAYYAAKASGYASADIRKKVFEKITNLSFLNLDKIKTGHLITVLTNDITLIGEIIMYLLRLIFRIPIILVGSILMAILISPKLSIILVFIVPITTLVVSILMKKAFPKFQEVQERVDDVNTVVRENVSGIRVVKAFVNENYEIDKFDKANKKLRQISVKAIRIINVTMPVMMLFINIAIVFVLWYGGIEVMNKDMLIGDIIAFIQYLSNILTSLLMASVVIVMLSHSEASALRINEVFNYKSDLKNTKKYKKSKLKGKIEFQNVDFSYDQGSGDLVLKNLNFVIDPGQTIGIVGSTGSGKTSLVSLIGRFYDITKGKILIDGVNIKDYDLKFIRKHVVFSLQQPVLFSGSIKDNLKYTNKDISDDEMIKVSKIACVHDFVMEKENHYDYKIEQKGTNLSGGQKQRISLARALLSKPDILVLDDTTSAVDINTDLAIRKGLKKFYNDITILMISSRISTVINADKIIVLDEGQIVGFDTHDKLLKENKVYQAIYKSQIKDGDLDD